MNTTPDTPELRPLAFAAHFTLIVAGLVALIAREFLRRPGLAPLILPLCRRLSRNAHRLATIMARLAAGRLSQRHPGKSGGGTAKPPIPTTRAWLIHTLRHEAAAYASQLSHLLAQQGVSELLAAAPTASRLLRPLCRMLGLPLGDRRAARRPRGRGNKRTECPDTASSAVAPQATGVFAFKNPESALLPAPSLPPPPCPHVGWPWFPRPPAKSA